MLPFCRISGPFLIERDVFGAVFHTNSVCFDDCKYIFDVKSPFFVSQPMGFQTTFQTSVTSIHCNIMPQKLNLPVTDVTDLHVKAVHIIISSDSREKEVDQVDARKWTAISNGKDQKLKSTFGILEALCVPTLTLFLYCWYYYACVDQARFA